jgi:hypothetical protein
MDLFGRIRAWERQDLKPAMMVTKTTPMAAVMIVVYPVVAMVFWL